MNQRVLGEKEAEILRLSEESEKAHVRLPAYCLGMQAVLKICKSDPSELEKLRLDLEAAEQDRRRLSHLHNEKEAIATAKSNELEAVLLRVDELNVCTLYFRSHPF